MPFENIENLDGRAALSRGGIYEKAVTDQPQTPREGRYRRGKRAEAEVLRRLTRALDRLNVSAQGEGGTPAQFLHAVHYIERGWTGSFSPENDSHSVPRDAPDFALSHDEAESIALALHQMFVIAKNARHTVGEAE